MLTIPGVGFRFSPRRPGGTTLAGPPRIQAVTNGARAEIFSAKGSGTILHLALVMDETAGGVEVTSTSSIAIQYDGNGTDDVLVPIRCLAGMEYPRSTKVDLRIHTDLFEMTSSPLSASNPPPTLNPFAVSLRLPIPFSNGIRIFVVAAANANTVTAFCNVLYTDAYWGDGLRFFATRSNEVVPAIQISHGNMKLTDATHATVPAGSFAADVVAGKSLVSGLITFQDMYIVQRVSNTSLIVSSKDTVDAVLNSVQAFDLTAGHVFLNRPAGKAGYVVGVFLALHESGGGVGDISSNVEGNPRFFLDGELEPSVEFTSIEDMCTGAFNFNESVNLQGFVGGLIGLDDVTNGDLMCYRMFAEAPIRYGNGIIAQVPSYGGFATTCNFTTLYYEQT